MSGEAGYHRCGVLSAHAGVNARIAWRDAGYKSTEGPIAAAVLLGSSILPIRPLIFQALEVEASVAHRK